MATYNEALKNNSCTRPLRGDVTLKSGLRLWHTHLPTGAQEVHADRPGDTMTEAEWDEYCLIIRGIQ